MIKFLKISFYTILLSIPVLGFSQQIEWKSWEEVIELSKTSPRKVVVDVYTDWCGWCKKMDKITFQQPQIAQFINDNFYAIRFNAEHTETIVYQDKEYKFTRAGKKGYHELAATLTKGDLRYPTVIILDEGLDVLQPLKGFQDPMSMELILTYYLGDHQNRTPWKRYTRTYNSKIIRAVPVGN